MANSIDLLILHGSPGAGKSSVAKAIAKRLRSMQVKHAVIELDDLAQIYPLTLTNIMYRNLATIWPNYVDMGNIKIIIPTYLQLGELELVKNAAPANKVTVCEITSPFEELQSRITKREADESRRRHILEYLNNYSDNSTEDRFIDFKISNSNRDVEETATEIINKLNW